jgi:hypothetical protein
VGHDLAMAKGIHGMVLDLVNSSSKFSISILMPKSLHWLLFMG